MHKTINKIVQHEASKTLWPWPNNQTQSSNKIDEKKKASILHYVGTSNKFEPLRIAQDRISNEIEFD